MPNYICWTKHGEEVIILENDEEEEGDNDASPDVAEYGSIADTLDDFVEDDLNQMMCDAEGEINDERMWQKFQRLIEDHKTLLYLDYPNGRKKLRTTLDLMQWKATNGVFDKGFDELLCLVKKILPKSNIVPETT